MKIRPKLLLIWDRLRTSFWFVPTLMVIAVCFLDAALPWLERADLPWMAEWLDEIGPGVPENARSLLATVAGSMITVSGVTFSVVMVALSIASSQFGPRLMVNFIRDRGNQVVLGCFVATFIYSLLALRRIGGDGTHVPHLTVAAAVVLTFVSVGVLIYFFHHVAVSIQAGYVVAQASHQLNREIADYGPPEEGRRDDDDEMTERRFAELGDRSMRVESRHTGYVAEIDARTLVEIAEANGLVVRATVGESDFVAAGESLAEAAPAGNVDDDCAGRLRTAFVVVSQRGTGRGVELAVDRLVEIAIRALSPSINDPFTAATCIDHLAAGLAQLAECGAPSRVYRDDDGEVRVLLHLPTIPELVERAFQQIRVYGAGDPTIVRRLLEAIALVAARTDDPDFRNALGDQAESVVEAARKKLADEDEVREAEELFKGVEHLLRS